MDGDHGDEFGEDGDVPPAKGSWWILIVAGTLAGLILVGAAIVIGFQLRDANRVVAADSSAAPPAPQVRVSRPACGGCVQSIVTMDGMTWADRLPRPVRMRLDDQVSAARGELEIDGARVYVAAQYAGTGLVAAECRAQVAGGGALTQATLDFLGGCVTASVPGNEPEVLTATRGWMEARFRPVGGRQPQVRWECGVLAVDFVLARDGGAVLITGRGFEDLDAAAAAMDVPGGCRES
jgi:hypothetical protein